MTKKTATVTTVSLELAHFNKDRKTLSRSTEYLDGKSVWSKIFIKSNFTGKEVEFVRMAYEHPLHDPDGWDGEIIAYIPSQEIPNVRALFVSHM